jgi:hypothetical protein
MLAWLMSYKHNFGFDKVVIEDSLYRKLTRLLLDSNRLRFMVVYSY